MCRSESWWGKSAVFRIYYPLTLNGYSNFINAVKRQRNLGLYRSGSTCLISPRFLCRLTALIMLLLPFKDRAWYIRKPSNLPHRSYDRHISTFRGYRFLFSIRNPYINRFTNYFSIHSKPSYPQKVVLHSITARFCLRSYYSAIWLPFSNLQTWSRDTNWMITVTHCMMGAT